MLIKLRLAFIAIILSSSLFAQETDVDTASSDEIGNTKLNAFYLEGFGISLTVSLNYIREIPLGINYGLKAGIGYAQFAGYYDEFDPLIPIRLLVYRDFGKNQVNSGIDFFGHASWTSWGVFGEERRFKSIEYGAVLESNYLYGLSKSWYTGAGILIGLFDTEFSAKGIYGQVQVGYKF